MVMFNSYVSHYQRVQKKKNFFQEEWNHSNMFRWFLCFIVKPWLTSDTLQRFPQTKHRLKNV